VSDPFDEQTEDPRAPRSPAGDGHNDITRVVPIGDAPPESFEQVFCRVFEPLSQVALAFDEPGVLLAAVWRNRSLESYVHLPTREGPTFGVMGRHKRCDLVLSQDTSVSLRHIMFGVSTTPLKQARIRLWDLASGVGFRTESDLPCEALVAEGPVFIRVGEYHLFCLPTGSLSPVRWSGKPQATWDALPDRKVLDQRLPRRAMRAPRQSVDASPAATITQLVPAARPVRSQRRPEAEGGIIVGHIELVAQYGEIVYPVSDVDLEYGLLIGRYDRCQLGGNSRKLSRIHLLIVRDNDELWAVDTASTNHSECNGTELSSVRIGTEAEIILAGVMAMRWQRRTFGEA
jgi:hypothetical protein